MISQSRVSRVEVGRVLPSQAVLHEWLRLTEAEADEAREITALWEQAATEAISLGRFRQAEKQADIAELERAATHVRTFQPVVIPGLLQVADYARRVMAMGYAQTDARAVAARLERQSILYDESKRFDFLVTEGALRWQPPDVDMRPQLDRLLSVASLPNVTLAIVPFRGAQIHFANQFILWELPGETMVTTETYSAELTITDAQDVARYREVWGRLLEAAQDASSVLQEW